MKRAVGLIGVILVLIPSQIPNANAGLIQAMREAFTEAGKAEKLAREKQEAQKAEQLAEERREYLEKREAAAKAKREKEKEFDNKLEHPQPVYLSDLPAGSRSYEYMRSKNYYEGDKKLDEYGNPDYSWPLRSTNKVSVSRSKVYDATGKPIEYQLNVELDGRRLPTFRIPADIYESPDRIQKMVGKKFVAHGSKPGETVTAKLYRAGYGRDEKFGIAFESTYVDPAQAGRPNSAMLKTRFAVDDSNFLLEDSKRPEYQRGKDLAASEGVYYGTPAYLSVSEIGTGELNKGQVVKSSNIGFVMTRDKSMSMKDYADLQERLKGIGATQADSRIADTRSTVKTDRSPQEGDLGRGAGARDKAPAAVSAAADR